MASASAHCEGHCLSVVVGPSIGSAFVGHSGVVASVEGCLSGRNFVRIRAPVLGAVPNNTTTEPFVARRGALSVSVCLHVTARLCLGELVINNVREICRVNEGFEGRNVSIHRGPRFAYVRLCRTFASCRNVVSVTRTLVHGTTDRIYSDLRVAFGNATVSLRDPFHHLAVVSTIERCDNISFTRFVDSGRGTVTVTGRGNVRVRPNGTA